VFWVKDINCIPSSSADWIPSVRILELAKIKTQEKKKKKTKHPTADYYD
jgi:hypothetical protein